MSSDDTAGAITGMAVGLVGILGIEIPLYYLNAENSPVTYAPSLLSCDEVSADECASKPLLPFGPFERTLGWSAIENAEMKGVTR